MEDSILKTIKKMLGYNPETETPFDVEIIAHINSALLTLKQIGFNLPFGFIVTDDTSTWTDIIPVDMNLENVKMYIYLKTRIVFDPPTSTAALDTMKEQIKEYEFRIGIDTDDYR